MVVCPGGPALEKSAVVWYRVGPRRGGFCVGLNSLRIDSGPEEPGRYEVQRVPAELVWESDTWW